MASRQRLPAPACHVYEQAYEWLCRQDDRGPTRLELATKTGWRDGRCGGALDHLVNKALVVRADEWLVKERVFIILP